MNTEGSPLPFPPFPLSQRHLFSTLLADCILDLSPLSLNNFFFCFEFLNFILLIFLYSRFLLVIYYIHISVYMSVPISQFIPPPPTSSPLSPLGVHMFVLYIGVSISALQTGSSVPFF